VRPVQDSPAGEEAAIGAPAAARSLGPGSDSRLDADGAPRRGVSIHVVVVTLVVALVAPAIGFLAYILHAQQQEQQRELAARGEQIARDIADRLDQEFTTLETMLAVFAASGWLDNNELERMHRRAVSALAGTDRHLIVLDAEFRQLLNTRVPFGTALGKTSDIATAAEVLRTGEQAISDVFQGSVSGTAVFNVLRPVTLSDGSRRVVILTRDAGSLAELFGPALRNTGWSFAVVDGAGQVVTAVTDPGEASAAVPAACRYAEGTGLAAVAPDTDARHVARRQVEGTAWSACAWAAVERLEGRLDGSWTALLTAIVAWLCAALLAAVLLSASISRAIANTARVGEALEAGREVPIPPSFVTEIDEVRRYLADAAAESIRKDKRLELLLRETAHRARNQLTLAVSLIGLSARNATSVDALKADITARLMALGRSIDAMSGTEFDAARLGELIRAQLEPFVDEGGDRLQMRGGVVAIPERTAQSLSLVLHELATNASKYGAWSRPAGKVVIAWRVAEGVLTLDWSETGAPAPVPERQGFGTKLVDTLVETGLGGTIDRRFGPAGFSCRISVPLDRVASSA
jgi:two-component sensor histidine kinase